MTSNLQTGNAEQAEKEFASQTKKKLKRNS